MSILARPVDVHVVQPPLSYSVYIGRMIGGWTQPLLWAWPLMLLIGAVHHDVFAAVPALGYWQTVLVKYTLGLLLPSRATDHWMWTKPPARKAGKPA